MSKKQVEHKFFTFETKAVDLEESEFTGFGAAIGNEDLGNDIIEPGAFKKTIDERVNSGQVKFLDNHSGGSTRAVWGTVKEAQEVPVDQVGENAPSHKLLTTFDVSESDPQAQIALKKIKEGHLDQLSIGFQPIKVEYEKNEGSDFDDPRNAWIWGEGVRRIKELKLWEISVVIWGMNPEATIIQNSLDSLTQFAQRVNQKDINVPEESVKEAVLALNSLLGKNTDSREQQQKIANALDEVSDAVDSVCSVAQKNYNPIRELLEQYDEEHGGWNKTSFGIWISDRAEAEVDNMTKEDEDCGCDQKDETLEDSPDDTAETEEKSAEEVDRSVEESVDEGSAESESEEKDVDEDEVEEEKVETITNKEIVEALGQLSETIVDLKEAVVGAEETDSTESEDQDADTKEAEEDPEPHTEDEDNEEEAVKNTDEKEDSRSEHFPDDEELATELAALEVIYDN